MMNVKGELFPPVLSIKNKFSKSERFYTDYFKLKPTATARYNFI
jgi:hypothetical protein